MDNKVNIIVSLASTRKGNFSMGRTEEMRKNFDPLWSKLSLATTWARHFGWSLTGVSTV